jgi:hypothetical protein
MPPTTPTQPPPAPKVGMFSAQVLDKLVKDTVPADRQHALVTTVDADGLLVAVKMVKNEHWEVEAAIKRSWSGDIQAGARVVYSW